MKIGLIFESLAAPLCRVGWRRVSKNRWDGRRQSGAMQSRRGATYYVMKDGKFPWKPESERRLLVNDSWFNLQSRKSADRTCSLPSEHTAMINYISSACMRVKVRNNALPKGRIIKKKSAEACSAPWIFLKRPPLQSRQKYGHKLRKQLFLAPLQFTSYYCGTTTLFPPRSIILITRKKQKARV